MHVGGEGLTLLSGQESSYGTLVRDKNGEVKVRSVSFIDELSMRWMDGKNADRILHRWSRHVTVTLTARRNRSDNSPKSFPQQLRVRVEYSAQPAEPIAPVSCPHYRYYIYRYDTNIHTPHTQNFCRIYINFILYQKLDARL